MNSRGITMAESLWKRIRYLLLFFALYALVASYFYTGWSRISLALAIFSTATIFAWPIWINKLELPAYRKGSRERASSGHCDILFLRPFAVDLYWRQLQDFLTKIVRTYNSQYAAFKHVIAVGRDDDGAIAKLPSADADWLSQVCKFANSAGAIVILPVCPDGPTSKSGILQEIRYVINTQPAKTIFVMPPRAAWERELKGTPLEGQLERLWAETAEHLQQETPSITLPAYKPAGCFWSLEGYDQYEGVTYYKRVIYPYSMSAVQKVLHKMLDNQRIQKNILMATTSTPESYARFQRYKRYRNRYRGRGRR